MKDRNPFLEDEEEVTNPFLENEPVLISTKNKKPSPKEFQETMERYDILGWPSRKATHAVETIGSDIKNITPTILNALMKIPTELAGTYSNISNDRMRLFRQAVPAAFANVANAYINTPPMIGRYLSHLGLAPDVLSKMPYADFSKEIQQNIIGGERRPGDVLVSNWPAIFTAASLIKNLSKGKGLKALGGESKELTAAKEAELTASREAKKDIGRADPDIIYNYTNKQQKRLQNVNEDINNLANEIDQIKVPELETGENAHVKNVENLKETLKQSQKQLPHVEALHENAIHELKGVEKNIGEHLETGADHHVDASKLIKRDLENLHEENNTNYHDVDEALAGQNIEIDNSSRIQELTNQILELTQRGRLESPEIQNLARELESLSAIDIIPASQYVDTYKSVKGYVRDAFERANERGINREERNLWLDRGNEMLTRLNQMENVLRDNLPNEIYDDLKKADSFWRTNIMPLYSEPLYWKIMNREKMPKNISESLAGGVEGSGLDIIKNIANSNPRVLKHIMGERWDSPSGRKTILTPNNRMRSYIDRMPELKSLLDNHKMASETVNRADIEKQKANFHHNVMEERYKEAEEQSKAHKEKIKEREKLTEEQKKKIKERDEIKKEIEDHLKHMENLYKTREKKESLEKSFKAHKEIEKQQKDMKKKVSMWKKAGKLPKAIFFGEYGIKELKKILKYFSD